MSRSMLHLCAFLAAVGLIILISFPFDNQQLGIVSPYGHKLLREIGLTITLAVSLNLILGIAGQFSLGHAGFAAAGAYTAALVCGNSFGVLYYLTQAPLHFSIGAGFFIILLLGSLAGMAVAGILGFVLGIPTLRLRGDYLAVATLGIGEILAVIFRNFTINDKPIFGGATGISLPSMRQEWISAAEQSDPLHKAPFLKTVFDYQDNLTYYIGLAPIFLLALLTIFIIRNIKYATSGRALLALREDPIAAESVGVHTTRYKVVAFVIGATLAGLAGGMMSHHEFLINPDSARFMRSIELVAMVILGGQGSITGSILAAILLTLLPELLRNATGWGHDRLHAMHWDNAAVWVQNLDIEKWRMVIYSLFIILAMLFRPNGLFGRYEISDVFVWLWRRIRPSTPMPTLPGHADEPVQPTPGPATLSAEREQPAEEWVAANTSAPRGEAILAAKNVTMQFGGLKAVDTFNLELRPGELVGLIGPNGAGKTTVFNVLTGVYCPTAGDITVSVVNPTLRDRLKRGADAGGTLPRRSILRKKPHAISHLGIARTFQNIRLFADLSVLDNVQIAQHAHHKQGIPSAIMRTPAFFREEAESRRRALGYLDLFDLAQYADHRANSLSYGDQRRLEIARALATRPRVLLLDEPAAGMNPTEKRELMEMIQSLRTRFGLTILLIEHDMKVVMGVCQRIIVLDYGKTIAQGTPDEIRKNPAVIQAYLGASA